MVLYITLACPFLKEYIPDNVSNFRVRKKGARETNLWDRATNDPKLEKPLL